MIDILIYIVLFVVMLFILNIANDWLRGGSEAEYDRRKKMIDKFNNEIADAKSMAEKIDVFVGKREFEERECGKEWSSSAPMHLNMEWKEMFDVLSKAICSAKQAFEVAQIVEGRFPDAPMQEYYTHLGFKFDFEMHYDDAIEMFEKSSELGASQAWRWLASARNKKREHEIEKRNKALEQEREERRTRIEKEGCYRAVKNGKDYELFVKGVLNRAGYQVEITPDSGDQGVDLIVLIGEKKIAIQCKFYTSTVGNAAVMQVAAGRDYYDCTHAMVVTNSTYTKQAVELSVKTRVWLEKHEDIVDRVKMISDGKLTEPSDIQTDLLFESEHESYENI